MTQEQKKYLLCTQHRSLLYIILHFGNGVMLLPQLRVFCLTLGLYANGQAVNRARPGLTATATSFYAGSMFTASSPAKHGRK